MPKYEGAPATAEHVDELAPRLRQADLDEIVAMGLSAGPHDALTRALACTPHALAGLIDGRCEVIMGVAPAGILTDIGLPWLLGSDENQRHGRVFLRRSREYMRLFLQDYRVLTNYVDSRNKASIAWLRWLGFDILPAAPLGPFGVPFHRFEMRRGDV